MKIAVRDFVVGNGIKFDIIVDNDTERALLFACVDNVILEEGDEEDTFNLYLPTSTE